MTPLAPRPALSARATFADDLALVRAAPDVPRAVSLLQADIDARLYRAQSLNIGLAPAKADLVHIITLSSSRTTPDDAPLVMIRLHPVHHSQAIKILGVSIDY